MKVFPTAALQFVDKSNTARTPASRKGYMGVLAQLQAAHPKRELDQFDTRTLTEFCFGEGLADNTIRHRKAKIRSFFDWCQWQGLVKENPAAGLRFTVKVAANGVVQHHWLTEAEVGHVVRSCPDTVKGWRAKVIVMHGFLLGLRLSELQALRWEQYGRDMGSLSFVGKGRKLAQLGVPPQLQAELKVWRREAPVGTNMVIPRLAHHRWSDEMTFDFTRTVSREAIGNIVKDVNGWSDIFFCPHDMRRSYAGILEAQGVPISDISRLLRHSNIGTTSRYLESNPHRLAKLGQAFSIAL